MQDNHKVFLKDNDNTIKALLKGRTDVYLAMNIICIYKQGVEADLKENAENIILRFIDEVKNTKKKLNLFGGEIYFLKKPKMIIKVINKHWCKVL